MNKHAVAFVSVFSLTLVLSVYYIMIPKGGTNAIEVGKTDNNNSTEVTNARSYYFESLIKERNDVYSENIEDLELKLVKASSNAEKEEILNEILYIKNNYDLECKTETTLAEYGYPLAYVKINVDNINVIVYENEPDNLKAVNIIKVVMNDTNKGLPVSLHFKS